MSEQFYQQLYKMLSDNSNSGVYISPEHQLYKATNQWEDCVLDVELPLESSSFTKQFSEELESIKITTITLQDDYQSRIESNEHPEWHTYEIAESELKSEQIELMNKAVAYGWTYICKDRYSNNELSARVEQKALESLNKDLDFESTRIECSVMDPTLVKKILGAYNSNQQLSEPAEDGFFKDSNQEREWLNAMRALMIQEYGWITPQKKLKVCTLHEHMQVAMKLCNHPEISELFKTWEKTTDQSRSLLFRLKNESKRGNKGAIQTIRTQLDKCDQEKSELENRIIAGLYAQGWIRLAVSQHTDNRYLHAEAKSDLGKKWRGLLVSISESTGLGLILNQRKISEPLSATDKLNTSYKR